MKDSGMPLQQRWQEFPFIVSDMLFPLLVRLALSPCLGPSVLTVTQIEQLLTWYLVRIPILPAPPQSDTSLDLGMHPQRARRTDAFRGPRLLRRLVELSNLGSIRSRLESPRPQFSPSARLSLLHLNVPSQSKSRDIRYVSAECSGARDVYGVDLQQGTRVLVLDAIDADATGVVQSKQVYEREDDFGERGFLDRVVYWAESVDQLVFDRVMEMK